LSGVRDIEFLKENQYVSKISKAQNLDNTNTVLHIYAIGLSSTEEGNTAISSHLQIYQLVASAS
jgi:hypothetical protein